MFYSALNNTFYPAELLADYEKNGTLPIDAVEVSRDVYDEVVSNRPANKIMVAGPDGLPMLSDIAVPTLVEAKESAYMEIDAQAGRTRSKYITDVAGQSETYLLKADDAKAYKAEGYPSANITLYPMVRAEAKAIYGETPTDAQYQLACDYIIGTQKTWVQLAANIEEYRRAGKEAIKAITVSSDATDVQIATAMLGVNNAKQAAITALKAL